MWGPGMLCGAPWDLCLLKGHTRALKLETLSAGFYAMLVATKTVSPPPPRWFLPYQEASRCKVRPDLFRISWLTLSDAEIEDLRTPGAGSIVHPSSFNTEALPVARRQSCRGQALWHSFHSAVGVLQVQSVNFETCARTALHLTLISPDTATSVWIHVFLTFWFQEHHWDEMSPRSTGFLCQYLRYVAEDRSGGLWILHLRPLAFGHFILQCVSRLSVSGSLLVYRLGANELSDTEHLVLASVLIN